MRERTAWLTLLHPVTGEPDPVRPARIQLKSRRSRAFVDADKAWGYRRLADGYNGKREVQAEDFSGYEAHIQEAHVGITVGWENVSDGGVDLPCNNEAIRNLYATDWIYEQVFAFTLNNANFGDKEAGTEPANLIEDAEKKSESGVVGDSELHSRAESAATSTP